MTTATRLLEVARAELGRTEHPPGTNRQPYAAEAGHLNGQPWCATFVVAIARRAGVQLPSESAYTPTMANGFRNAGAWIDAWGDAQPGDLAFFDWPDTKRIQHVGIVESATPSSVTCIEGNTSPADAGSQDNGGGVYRRVRPRSHVVGYGRPTYNEDDDMASSIDVIGQWLKETEARLSQRILDHDVHTTHVATAARDAVLDTLRLLSATGAAPAGDLDALADKIADKLAERLAS
jgi:hypothetical protein